MTNGELLAAPQVMEQLKHYEALPFCVGHAIGRNLSRFAIPINVIKSSLEELQKKYCKMNDDGTFVTKEVELEGRKESILVFKGDDDRTAYLEAQNDLLQEDAQVQPYLVKLEKMDGHDASVIHSAPLHWMFTNGEGET